MVNSDIDKQKQATKERRKGVTLALPVTPYDWVGELYVSAEPACWQSDGDKSRGIQAGG